MGAACARSQEHPEGCRCRRRGGGVRVADGRAWGGWRTSLPSPPEASEGPAETTEPPGRAELMAALRASVEIGGAKEAAFPADRRRRKRRRPEQAPPSAPPQPSALPHASAPAQPEAPPVNNAVLWHVDKSALPLSEPRRYRDRAHLEFVASQPCLLCGRQPSRRSPFEVHAAASHGAPGQR